MSIFQNCPRCSRPPILSLRKLRRRLRCCIGKAEGFDIGLAVKAWDELCRRQTGGYDANGAPV